AIALAQARRAGCRGRNRVFIFSFSKKYLIPALVSSALRHLLFLKNIYSHPPCLFRTFAK
ncbi:MAG: hypothetical protein KKI12_08935, partial [Proteobacteria bacterium]|nr:hypothetical protein [Pseudomonadota bacterium]